MRPKYWFWVWKTFLGPSRLRRKFVRALGIAGFIPLLFMSIVSFYLVNLTHNIDITTIEHSVSQQVASEIERFIENTFIPLELVVTFDDFAPIAFTQQGFLLESLLSSNSAINELSLICLTPAACKAGHETNRWSRKSESVSQEFELRDLNNDPGFIRAKTGESHIGNSYFEDGRTFIPIATPVYNQNNEIISVLSGIVSLRPVQQIVNGSLLGKTGYVFIIDSANVILAHPLPGFVGTEATHLPPLETRLAGAEYKNINEETVHGVQTAIGQNLGWHVVVEWPQEETQQLVWAILGQIIGFSLLTLLIITIVASYLAMRLIKPITELSQGTSVIGSGNFDYRVDIKTDDELEDLGKHLNKMAKNLKSIEDVKELRMQTDLLSKNLASEKELSKLKDQFITTVSHQFNTPLSVIKWAISVLQDQNADSESRKKSINVIIKSQNDIASMLSDLITITQIGFEYEKASTDPVNVATIVEKVINYLKDVAEVKNVKLNFRQNAKNMSAKINAFTIEKAIENLIDNAIGYSHEGTVVDIELSDTDTDIIFKISDKGIGIPEDEKKSIFKEFFRAKNAVRKKNVGTGLGLYIVKRIADGHKGKVWFESEEDKGSTFYLSISRE